MAVFTKNVTTGSWTSTALWSPTGYPGQNGAADQALWNSTGSGCSVANATLGQICASSLTVSPIITNVAGQILTLSPAGSYSGVGIFINHTTSTSFTLSVNGAIKLNESQSFSVVNGNTLNVGGNVSSTNTTDVLTKVGIGTLTLSGTNTWGGSGGGFVASAGLTTASNASSFGNASNTVTVNSGAGIAFTAIPNQTVFAMAGTGSSSQLAAMHSTVAFASGKTITVSGGDVALSFGLAASFAAKITGASTGDVILNFTTATTTASFNNASTDFTVGGGKYVRIRSVNVTTGVGASGSYVPGASEAGLGNAANKVFVESTASVNAPASSAITLARDYKFEGETTSGGLASGKNWAIELAGNASCVANFTGTIEGNTANYVKVASSTAAPFGTAKFSGTFSGTWNLQGYAAGSTLSILWLDSTLNVSGWTGNIDAALLTYGMSPGGAVTYGHATTTLDSSVSNLVVSHTGYTRTVGTTVTFTGSNSLTLGPIGSSWSAAPGTWNVAASTLSLLFDFNGTTSTLLKSGAGTLALSGNNAVGVTGVVWNAGNLTLNSNNSAGSTGSTFTAASTGTLDSTTGATLGQTGANALNANFTWGGSGDLTLSIGNTTLSAARTISFLNGKTAKLTFPGNWTTALASSTLSVGGTPIGGSRSRLSLVGTNASLATTGTVTAGYFRVANAAGLGAVGTTTGWTVSSGGAIEVNGTATIPSTKNATITGPGPNTDGALRSVSGANIWSGAIVPPVQSLASPTRIQVDAGTFTLATGLYTTIAPMVSATPLQFTALSSATLNQQRLLTANVSDVTVNNGGTGTVVFSAANLHSGAMTCSAGTTKLTHVNAAGAGAGNNVTVLPGATMESTVKAVFPATLTLGSSGSAATFKISV